MWSTEKNVHLLQIEHLCKELIVKVNKGVYNSGQSSSVKTRHSIDAGKSPRYGTRVAKGVAAVKDYR